MTKTTFVIYGENIYYSFNCYSLFEDADWHYVNSFSRTIINGKWNKITVLPDVISDWETEYV